MDVLIVLPPLGFFDEEVTVSLQIFDESKVSYEIATTERGYCKGLSGMIIQADKTLDEVAPTHYTTILVIGGAGTRDLWDNETLLTIIKDAQTHGNILAGINAGVGVLARAGVLEGKKATTFSSPQDLDILSSSGVMYVQKPVVVDDHIVTAEGPSAMLDFMVELLDQMGVEWYTI
jgi:protease I